MFGKIIKHMERTGIVRKGLKKSAPKPVKYKLEGSNNVTLATEFQQPIQIKESPSQTQLPVTSALPQSRTVERRNLSLLQRKSLDTTEYEKPDDDLVSFERKSAYPQIGVEELEPAQKAIEREVTRTLAHGEGKSPSKGGEFPTKGSGVTYGRGIDLKHLTKKQLVAAGATPEKIAELTPWLGKDQTALTAEGLTGQATLVGEPNARPEVSTILSDKLAFNLIQKHKKKIKPLAKNLSETGKEVAISLRHWSGALGNIKKGNKLVVTKGGKRTNPVWNALKGGAATDATLLTALKETRDAHTVKWKRNRIQKEINKLKNP
jgi:hypothetical protein